MPGCPGHKTSSSQTRSISDRWDAEFIDGCTAGNHIGATGGARVDRFSHNLTALAANLHDTIPSDSAFSLF